MKTTVILALLLLAPLYALAQNSDDSIHVKVNLVNVFVSVTDANGAPVAGLSKDNFQLSEDDEPQKIAVFDKQSALPLSIVLALDTSLSTRRDLPLELASARQFAHDVLRPVDGLSLFEFSDEVQKLTPFSADMKQLDRAIQRIKPGGATALYDALYLGAQELETRQPRKVMVVITDGGDTVSSVDYKEAVRAEQEAEAVVYSIIVVPVEASAGRDTGGEHALVQISHDTGGQHFYATSGPDLDNAFHKISDELRTQYLLAYYPQQRYSDSDFRHISVKITGVPGMDSMKLRYRTGYYTSKSH